MMINKSKKFGLTLNERGTLSGFPLILLTLILVAAVLGLLAHWFLGGSSGSSLTQTAQTVPTPTSAAGSNSQEPDALWHVLDAKLKNLDFFKLQTQAPGTKTAMVDGKNVSVHWESYRLPELYTPQQLADLLVQAAIPLGAKLVQPMNTEEQPGLGTVYSCLYAGGALTPVQMDWVVTSKPRICIIIDDAGYQKGAALDALYDFKVPVTVSIIPHTEYSNFLAQDFPDHGVEVMCHLPMEGHDHVPAGAYKEYLKKGMDVEKAKKEVESGLADLPNCRGLNNHMGSVATTDLSLMTAVCEELKTENMFVIDSRTSPKAVVSQAAHAVGLPVAQREFFLDNTKSPSVVLKQMRLTAAFAKKHGLAVAIGHFNVITLKTLKVVVQKLQNEGFQFVYASEVVKE
jgi:polysaccharide deacetylase 2 family uncharacterized protein YibQ